MPLPLRPVTATRSPGARSRSIGPSRKRASLADRALERGDALAGPLRRRQRRGAAPRARTASRRARSARARAPPGAPSPDSALVPRRSEPPVAWARKPPPARAWLRRACRSASTSRRRSCESSKAAYCFARATLARRGVVAPAARVLAQAAGPGVDLGDARHRPVEKGAVVRDDREAAGEAVDEALQALEAVEVEVVRRLVEQEQVEAGEQDRRERRPGGLPAGERRRLLLERDGQAELGADRSGACLEVAAAERQEALERGGVASGLHSAVCRFTAALGVRDAGAPRQVAEQRLAGAPVVLLRQVADRERGRRPLDRALVRLVEPGGEAKQRRLARAVRADEAEPRARAERQVDAVENGLGAERAADAVERDSHERAPPETRGRGRAQRVRRKERLCLV